MAGRSKAKFFRHFGFDETNLDLLEKSFMAIAHTQHVKEEKPSSHGVKYLIDGTISSPIGKSVKVITVWIIDKGQSRPRFITAYPG